MPMDFVSGSLPAKDKCSSMSQISPIVVVPRRSPASCTSPPVSRRTRTPSPPASTPTKASLFSISSILSRPDATERTPNKDLPSPTPSKHHAAPKLSPGLSPPPSSLYGEKLRSSFGSHVQDMIHRAHEAGAPFTHHPLLHPGLSPAFLDRQLPGKPGPWFPWLPPHPYLHLALGESKYLLFFLVQSLCICLYCLY